MIEIIFLFSLALIFLIFASFQDLKTRIVYNWISFSLIVFALGFRFFFSLFNENWIFFYQGIIGLGIFFIIGNLLYYGRMFAGGDAKLMIALGAVLPISNSFSINANYFSLFILLFVLTGAVYGTSWSIFLSVKNYKSYSREFTRQFAKYKKVVLVMLFLGILVALLGFYNRIFLYLGFLIFISPYLFIYAKAVDEACMIKRVNTKKLVEGDWLCGDVKAGKIIKSNWHGLSEEEIKLIRKNHRFVKIKEGIPFVPVFLVSFLIYFIFTVFFLGAKGFSLLPF